MPARTTTRTANEQPRPGPPRPAAARPPHAFLDLGPVRTAPGCARAWTRAILWEWGLASLAGIAEIVVSELVATSVNVSRSMDQAVIRLILTIDRGELTVLVRDDHPAAPMRSNPGADDEDGRGLLLVRKLTDRSGWYPLENGDPGKVVWAVITESSPAVSGPRRQRPGGDAEVIILDSQLEPAFPTRRRQVPSPTTQTTALKWEPVDPGILARVKTALERL